MRLKYDNTVEEQFDMSGIPDQESVVKINNDCKVSEKQLNKVPFHPHRTYFRVRKER